MELGQLYVAVDCDDCGEHPEGIPEGENSQRCGRCGQYAEAAEGYCAEHNVNYKNLPGYDHCPYCRERSRIERLEQERMERRADPRMHPTVDSPRW
jgi:ssDNA-binding Zn-finger/Zn-ribbon topoisomerase 1